MTNTIEDVMSVLREDGVSLNQLIEIVIHLRPNGIEAQAIPEIVKLIYSYTVLELTREPVREV